MNGCCCWPSLARCATASSKAEDRCPNTRASANSRYAQAAAKPCKPSTATPDLLELPCGLCRCGGCRPMGEPRQQGQVLKSPMAQVLALLSSKLDDCPSMQCRNWGVCECQR